MFSKNKNLFGAVIAIVALISAGTVSAADLLVTSAQGKSGKQVSLDIVSDGEISGFNFVIGLQGAKASSADLSNCLSGLPKSFGGKCQLTNGKIYVFAMANGLDVLPAGVVTIGSLGMNTSSTARAKGVTALTIDSIEFVDVKGAPIAVKSHVDQSDK